MALVVVLFSLMLVMLAGACILWRAAAEQRRRAASTAFIDRQLQRQSAPAGPMPAAGPAAWKQPSKGIPVWDSLLLRAGVTKTKGFYAGLLLPIILLPLFATLLLSSLAGAVVLVAVLVLSYFRLWLMADKRRRRMIFQLPNFLEAMVRLITIGNSMGAAFQSAAAAVDAPLKEVVDRAANVNRSGKDLDAALAQVSRQYDLVELQLVAAVVSISLRFGGRSDQVLERMAAFMRDLEQSRAELVAMSAEVRLSAWILALLPLGIAGFIVVVNSRMFIGMWEDPLGFKMLMFAVGLQVFGSWWLYRMARSI